MVGFSHNIILNDYGKIEDYQKNYNQNYSKILNVYLPLKFNNKKHYKAELQVSITNTFPKRVESVTGYKVETDFNRYEFDVTQLYYLNIKRKFGLCQIVILDDKDNVVFKSENFRLQ